MGRAPQKGKDTNIVEYLLRNPLSGGGISVPKRRKRKGGLYISQQQQQNPPHFSLKYMLVQKVAKNSGVWFSVCLIFYFCSFFLCEYLKRTLIQFVRSLNCMENKKENLILRYWRVSMGVKKCISQILFRTEVMAAPFPYSCLDSWDPRFVFYRIAGIKC